MGVPGRGFRKFTGTQSTSRSRSTSASSTRCSGDSPMPRMPPVQSLSPMSLGGADRVDLLLEGVGGADLVEVAGGGLEVVVQVHEPGRLEPRDVRLAHEAERGAGLHGGLGLDEPDGLLDDRRAPPPSRCACRCRRWRTRGRRPASAALACSTISRAVRSAYVGRVGVLEVGRLGAEAAVLGAGPGLGVGDAAQAHLVAVDGVADGAGAVEQGLELGAGGEPDEAAGLVGGDGLDSGGQRGAGLAHGAGGYPPGRPRQPGAGKGFTRPLASGLHGKVPPWPAPSPSRRASTPAPSAAIPRPKWLGQCPSCHRWNTLHEEVVEEPRGPAARTGASGRRRRSPSRCAEVVASEDERVKTGIGELDRVLGGGVVPGIAGAPRRRPGHRQEHAAPHRARPAGASSSPAGPVLYVSGEESARQVKLRADRLGVDAANLHLLAETDAVPRAPRRRRSSSRPSWPSTPSRPSTCPSSPRAPGHGHADPRGDGPAHGLRQDHRDAGLPGRPRHQGRRHRRAARPRAHGRHRPLLRGGRRPPLPRAARPQEPLRLGQRDRRLRDEGRAASPRWRTRRPSSWPSGRRTRPGAR